MAAITNIRYAAGKAGAKSEKHIRLTYLDGLRGLAALYVALGHAANSIPHDLHDVYPTWLRIVTKPFNDSQFAVDLFIVLSGYSLMLPVARSVNGRIEGGFGGYLKRRALRIMPAYYAALLLSIPMVMLGWALQHRTHIHLAGTEAALTAPVLISHVFLIHNLSKYWAHQIDVPMWSIATEWQIYFLFPWLLLPVWRRFGIVAAVLMGFTIGIGLHFIVPGGRSLDQARFWYIGLFALGMMAALIEFSSNRQYLVWRDKTPWLLLAWIFGLSVVVAGLALPNYRTTHAWLFDTFVGSLVACFLVSATRATFSPNGSSRAVGLLTKPLVQRLGAFSYSLYLVHFPIILVLNLALKNLVRSPAVDVLFNITVGMPVALACAYGFHLLFEKPFLRSRQSAKPEHAEATISMDPALTS